MSNSRIQEVQAQVDEVVNVMQDNIKATLQRGENLNNLNERTDQLQNSSSQFHRHAKEVRKQMFWKDVKTRIMLAVLICLIVGAVIALIVWATGTKATDGGASIGVPNPTATITTTK